MTLYNTEALNIYDAFRFINNWTGVSCSSRSLMYSDYLISQRFGK